MEEYYEPDSRWEPHSIKDEKDYEKKVIIKGYFHEDVPEDVLKEFITAEYLMAHAYYYWPMFDEAFSKCLLILEMAVKLKAKQVEIPTAYKNKQGEPRDRRLVEIIDELCEAEHYEMLRTQLHRARKLRNMVVHPDRHSFAGPSGLNRNIRLFVNVLNRLFRNERWHESQYESIKKAQSVLNKWGEKPIVIETEGLGFLFFNVQAVDVFEENLLVTLISVPNFQKKGIDAQQPFPKSYLLREYSYRDNCIVGKTVEGVEIRLFSSDNEEHRQIVDECNTYLKQFSKRDLEIGILFNEYIAPMQLVDIEYEYLEYLYG